MTGGPGPGLHLRAWADADARATLDVFRRAVHGTARCDYSPAQLAAWAPQDLGLEGWSTRRREAGTVVAEVDGRVVGFADLGATGHIGMLYVDPSVARTGVATALLENAVSTALALGLRELTTHASRTARPFFERHGFVVEQERHPVARGVPMAGFAMRRELPGS